MRLHVHLDAKARRFRHQEARRADPALAEMKIVANGNAADPEPFDKIMVNEILRRGLGAVLVECHHHGAGESGSSQQPQFRGLVGQAELRGVRAEIASGVRFECHRHGRLAMRPSHSKRRVDHGAMAQMDAVEIAHRHHHSLRNRCRRGRIAYHRKISRHLGNSSFLSLGAGP